MTTAGDGTSGDERRSTRRVLVGFNEATHLRRLGPPSLDRGQLTRRRLIARLHGRFDRRATVVVGGPGFGKSTLLAQALRENRVAPLGTDHWLSCTHHDRDAPTFVTAVFHAAGLEAQSGGPPTTPEELLGALARLAPGSCLVLDDLHEIPVGSDGHRAVQALVQGLPAQCSIVLGSRVLPDVPLALWTSRGEVEVIAEHDLRFTAEEVEALGHARGADAQALSTATNGGWPALVELELAAGRSGSDAYLREAVLGAASPQEQRVLAVLDAIAGGDRELAEAAAGVELSETLWRRLASFPMLQPVDRDGLRPHRLWEGALASVMTDDERRAARVRAAEALLARGRHDDAFSLFAALGDGDGCRAVVTAACSTGCTQLGLDTIERWATMLPPEAGDSAEAKLLRGLVARDGSTFDASTIGLLQSAAEGFRAAELLGPEVATLAEIGFVAREQGLFDVFATVVNRLFELAATGRPEVTGMLHLGAAVLAEAGDDEETNLRELLVVEREQVSPQLWSRILWLRGHAEMMLGRPERGREHALSSIEHAETGFLGGRYLLAYLDWWCDPTARTIDALPDITTETAATPFDEVYGGSVLSAVHAFCGHAAVARRGFTVAKGKGDDAFRQRLRPEYLGVLALSEAALLAAEGDDASASDVVRGFFERFGIESPDGRRFARRFPGLVHVLMPEARAAIDAAPYGPAMDRARRAAHWFETLAVDPAAGARVALSTLAPLVNVLPLRWCLLALARLATVDQAMAAAATEELVGTCGPAVRSLLRAELEQAERSGDRMVVDGARRLLGAVPIAPPQPIRVDLLGPLRVSGHALADADSARLVDAELRRERVRQLIVLLALRRSLRRDEAAAHLWPELDPKRSSQNLRTTLTYVNRVFEPERDARDAAFVLRTSGEVMSLVGRPWVETDVERFDGHLLEADEARSAGVHTHELAELEQALALVRGAPLADAMFEEWAEPHVRRVNASIAFAARRAAELCFAQERFRDAEQHAATCLTFDPYNDAAHRFAVAAPLGDGRLAAAHAALQGWVSACESLGVAPPRDVEMLRRRVEGQSAVLDAPSDRGAAAG